MNTLLTATAYFPPVVYIAECLAADRVVIELHETYPKQTCRNHCGIAGPNGRQQLTVPVIKPSGNHTKTKEVRISNDLPWQKAHLRSITTAYNKSPFLLFYMDHFLPLFEKKYKLLTDLNRDILERAFRILEITAEITFTESYEKESAGMKDLRTALVSKHPAAGPPLPSYTQPFSERYGFLENLSALDLIFCLGPEAKSYLRSIPVS
jgi:hypothetical protein